MDEKQLLDQIAAALREEFEAVGIVVVKKGEFGKATVTGEAQYVKSIGYIQTLINGLAELVGHIQEQHGFIPWDD